MKNRNIFILPAIFLSIFLLNGCGQQQSATKLPVENECGISKEMISESSKSQYPCETDPKCEWKYLGGKVKSYYACCPKDLLKRKDPFIKFKRCFTNVD